ncbi:MAG TPA: glycoside hydrolase family 44 protein [Burkholderiaceae bacterium]|nr:glycoside hydrolase family 44 protein [Burkholderiaceae bacterium]
MSIDATASVHPISPLVYGVNSYNDVAATLSAINSPINRFGGNASTQYNWKVNATNRGSDWFFESTDEGSANPGQAVLDMVNAGRQAGAQSMVTVPMLGWVAKQNGDRSKLSSFSLAKYGAQQASDSQWMADAGNGVRADGTNITGNDPNDADVPADASFHQGLVQLLGQNFGNAASGGVRYYIMDNEHSLWQSSHRNVHPQGAGMDEVYSKLVSTASMVKSIDPSAQIVGPEEWGWTGYLYSGKDQQAGNANDKLAHGGMDYMPWLLKQMKAYETANGKRLLDVFSLHFYPQGGENSDDTSIATQQRRNRSTRALWDPSYVDETWINTPVQLIPRMKAWVQNYYPGTKIALTEYDWGAVSHISGAIAQADILGILGREGVDIATRWGSLPIGSPVFKAFQMYRNYDGVKSTFGETSVSAAVPNPDTLSAFAALRASDHALTVMVINKDLSNTAPVSLKLAHFGTGSGTVQRWQLTSANTIVQLGSVSYGRSAINDSVPPQSITLYVVK